MKRYYLLSFILFILLTASECKNKLAVYSAIVVNENDNPIEKVQVLIEKDGCLIPTYSTHHDTLIGANIEKINKGKMFKEIVTDSNGEFKVALTDSYIISPPEYKIHLVKEGYKKLIIDIKWGVDIDNKIVLKKAKD